MFTTDLPDEKPRITGVQDSYGAGERVRALCTSWQSHPPANLSWFINAEPVRAHLRSEKNARMRSAWFIGDTVQSYLEHTCQTCRFFNLIAPEVQYESCTELLGQANYKICTELS